MQINLSPVRMDEQVTLVRQGDILYVNGEAFDFSPLQEGATLPWGAVLSDWFPGTVERIGGELHLTIRLPHGPNAPESTRFPVPITVLGDGPVTLPDYGFAEVQTSRALFIKDHATGKEYSIPVSSLNEVGVDVIKVESNE